MSETEGQRNDSPLLSERGVTTISDTVVSSLAGMAAQEVDGVHMGGGASRAAGGVLGSITDRVESMTGLRIKELNATITDITFPETEARRSLGRAKPPSEPDESQEETPATAPETRATPEDEYAERETTQAETTEAETTEAAT